MGKKLLLLSFAIIMITMSFSSDFVGFNKSVLDYYKVLYNPNLVVLKDKTVNIEAYRSYTYNPDIVYIYLYQYSPAMQQKEATAVYYTTAGGKKKFYKSKFYIEHAILPYMKIIRKTVMKKYMIKGYFSAMVLYNPSTVIFYSVMIDSSNHFYLITYSVKTK